MQIPPKYFLTPRISELLSQIEANRAVIDAINIPTEIELNIRRKSTLKSSVYSARIEGSNATIDNLAQLSPKDRKKVEINNLLRAINYISGKKFTKITTRDILNFHKMTMQNLDFETLGKFRSTHEGIFTAGGIVVYHAPPPSQIPLLIDRLLKFSQSQKEKFVPIRAVLAHYSFEKIHPFVDGSGRAGRLLMLVILKSGGYGFKGILPFEEQIDKRREEYYRMLEEPERDVTNYIEFMLEVVADASEMTKMQVLGSHKLDSADLLLPRRAEILKLIKDQKIINFDSIKRRFANINDRTLRYDLKKLTDSGFVQKLGTTRGVYYKATPA